MATIQSTSKATNHPTATPGHCTGEGNIMTQLLIRHISTNKYGHRLSAYETPKMTGYIVSVTADGITSQYDFLDSMELALEYRDALDAACESWNQEATRAENLYEATGNENGFASAGKMWAGYMLLAHNAIYPRWELEPMAEAAEMADLDETYAKEDTRFINFSNLQNAIDRRRVVSKREVNAALTAQTLALPKYKREDK